MKSIIGILCSIGLALSLQAQFIINPYQFAAGGGGGATDWTADPTMVALYLFNSGGISDDSSGKANHANDATLLTSPSASSGDKIEGDQAADFENAGNDQGFALTISTASADFIANGTGDGEITMAGWVKCESSAATQYFVTIPSITPRFSMASANTLFTEYHGAANVTLASTATITDGAWWFVATVYSNANDQIRIYLRQQGSGSSTWETVSAATVGTLDDASAQSFIIGASSDATSAAGFDGLMDAWAIFNGKAFTQAELDSVFTNGWDGNGW